MNGGHGHVIPRPDGAKARCGGPALCSVCAAELAAEMAKPGGRGLYAAVNEAIGAAVAAERARIITVARKMGATYPVTLEPEPGSEGSTRYAFFPFGDYLEDVPAERQGERSDG